MAESYAKHAQQLESEAMKQERSENRWSRKVAAGIVIAVLVACLIALALDKEDFAIALGSWTIVALAAVFIAGKVPNWIGKGGS